MPFQVFYLTSNSCNTCVTAMDTPVRRNQSDANATKNFCGCMQFFLLPLFFTFDIVSLPVRGVIHACKK